MEKGVSLSLALAFILPSTVSCFMTQLRSGTSMLVNAYSCLSPLFLYQGNKQRANVDHISEMFWGFIHHFIRYFQQMDVPQVAHKHVSKIACLLLLSLGS